MGLTETLFSIDKVFIFNELSGIIIEVDAALREEHKSEADVTSHPVERGAGITDHIRLKPREFTLTGVVSNTPLYDLLSPNRFDSGARAEAAWQNLIILQETQALVTVITTLETYDKLAIVSISCPRDASRGNVVEFTATFRQIFYVVSETISINPKVPRPPKQALGNAVVAKAKAATIQSVLGKMPVLLPF